MRNNDFEDFPLNACKRRLEEQNVPTTGDAAPKLSEVMKQIVGSVITSSVERVLEEPARKKRRITPEDVVEVMKSSKTLNALNNMVSLQDTAGVYESFAGTVFLVDGSMLTDTCEYIKAFDKLLSRKGSGCVPQICCSPIDEIIEQNYFEDPDELAVIFQTHLQNRLHQSIAICMEGAKRREKKAYFVDHTTLGLRTHAVFHCGEGRLSSSQIKLFDALRKTSINNIKRLPSKCHIFFYQTPSECVESLQKKYPTCILDISFFQCLETYWFEMMLRSISTGSRFVFFRGHTRTETVLEIVKEVLAGERECPRVFYDPCFEFSHFSNKKRHIYAEEADVSNAYAQIQKGTLELVDMAMFNIKLWQKPKRIFERLVFSHLCRFESICFYAMASTKLNHEELAIVQWLCGAKMQR